MKIADFLAPDNICGQTLLKLVARGNAIIAELLRLSDFVPPIFQQTTTSTSSADSSLSSTISNANHQKYGELIFDFAYFKQIDQIEANIENNEHLLDLDDEIRENYLEILTRFYLLFESIYRYATDLNRYIEDLEEGSFIQQNLETVLNNVDGKQLLAESLFLFGVMLINVDVKIDGIVRERLLISYYRYSGRRSSSESNIDDVCRLLRSTGFTRGKTPANYPENYFKRVLIDKTFVNMVIGRLRSDDIYNQIVAFPLPDHRSTALAQQASMLYVCLYFAPEILHNHQSTMREIVDKFFCDNWVVSVYMGSIVNLVEVWDTYKAAKSALSNVLQAQSVRLLIDRHIKELSELNAGLAKYLNEGTLTKEFILENADKVIKSLRRCNVVLRWLMLHCAPISQDCENVKKCTQLRDMIVSDGKVTNVQLFQLLLNTSQFEFLVKEKLREMLTEKSSECQNLRNMIAKDLNDLASVFSGSISTPLIKVDKNDKLKDVFNNISERFSKLEFDDEAGSGRKIAQLFSDIEQVQEVYGLDNNSQIRQFIVDIRQSIHQLLRRLHLKEDTLVQIQTISDLSYAWEIVENFTDLMQKGIRQNPQLAIKLRATFLKLSSVMDFPLMRIQQSNSPDLVSVSQFYSKNLVLYFRRVLQIIPQTVFALLARIVDIRTKSVKELPTRLDKDKMKEYAKLDDRYEIARLTHSISVLTEGVLTVKATLVGIIKVDPKQMLEDGIRKELVKNVATAMHDALKFNQKSKQSELIPKLKNLSAQVDAYRLSFEYISDYIGLSGLKIWQEEFSRIVNYNVEQECNVYLRHKVQDWESLYQSKLIPIPKFQKLDSNFSFIGRLADEILKETDPKSTNYVDHCNAWFDCKSRKEIVNIQMFKVIINAVGNIGVAGLDKLYSFMLTNHTQNWINQYKKEILTNRDHVDYLTNAERTLENYSTPIDHPSRFYGGLCNKFSSKLLTTLTHLLAKIGQIQIVRLHFSRELNILCKFEAKLYENALQVLNKCLMIDVRACEQDTEKLSQISGSALLNELASYLDGAGISDPLMKIYLMPHLSVQPFSVFILVLLLNQIQKFAFIRSVGLISKKPMDTIDGFPFVIGLVTLLRQVGSSVVENLLAYLGQYFNSFIIYSLTNRSSLPSDFYLSIHFLLQFVHYYDMDRTLIERYIPKTLLDEHETLLS